MNPFENHLRENRKQLNMDQINPKIWLNIENEILRKRNRRNRVIIRWVSAAAASVAILFLIGQVDLRRSHKISPAAILAQYNLEKFDYPELIYAKTEKLSEAQIPSAREEDFAILIKQLEFLDGQYQEYLTYIQKNGYQKFIGKQLASYYETKIELLDKIQSEIEKIKLYENNDQEISPLVDLKL